EPPRHARLASQSPARAGSASHFGHHPDADIYLSQPGLGVILGARVLAEFGDDKHRYVNAKARRNYAGTSPLTRQSGKKKTVLARYVHNDRLLDALSRQAFVALTSSPIRPSRQLSGFPKPATAAPFPTASPKHRHHPLSRQQARKATPTHRSSPLPDTGRIPADHRRGAIGLVIQRRGWVMTASNPTATVEREFDRVLGDRLIRAVFQ